MAKSKAAVSRYTSSSTTTDATDPSAELVTVPDDEEQLHDLIQQAEIYLSSLPYSKEAGKSVSVCVDFVAAGRDPDNPTSMMTANLSFSTGKFALEVASSKAGKRLLSDYELTMQIKAASKIPRLIDFVEMRSKSIQEQMQQSLQGLRRCLPTVPSTDQVF